MDFEEQLQEVEAKSSDVGVTDGCAPAHPSSLPFDLSQTCNSVVNDSPQVDQFFSEEFFGPEPGVNSSPSPPSSDPSSSSPPPLPPQSLPHHPSSPTVASIPSPPTISTPKATPLRVFYEGSVRYVGAMNAILESFGRNGRNSSKTWHKSELPSECKRLWNGTTLLPFEQKSATNYNNTCQCLAEKALAEFLHQYWTLDMHGVSGESEYNELKLPSHWSQVVDFAPNLTLVKLRNEIDKLFDHIQQRTQTSSDCEGLLFNPAAFAPDEVVISRSNEPWIAATAFLSRCGVAPQSFRRRNFLLGKIPSEEKQELRMLTDRPTNGWSPEKATSGRSIFLSRSAVKILAPLCFCALTKPEFVSAVTRYVDTFDETLELRKAAQVFTLALSQVSPAKAHWSEYAAILVPVGTALGNLLRSRAAHKAKVCIAERVQSVEEWRKRFTTEFTHEHYQRQYGDPVLVSLLGAMVGLGKGGVGRAASDEVTAPAAPTIADIHRARKEANITKKEQEHSSAMRRVTLMMDAVYSANSAQSGRYKFFSMMSCALSREIYRMAGERCVTLMSHLGIGAETIDTLRTIYDKNILPEVSANTHEDLLMFYDNIGKYRTRTARTSILAKTGLTSRIMGFLGVKDAVAFASFLARLMQQSAARQHLPKAESTALITIVNEEKPLTTEKAVSLQMTPLNELMSAKPLKDMPKSVVHRESFPRLEQDLEEKVQSALVKVLSHPADAIGAKNKVQQTIKTSHVCITMGCAEQGCLESGKMCMSCNKERKPVGKVYLEDAPSTPEEPASATPRARDMQSLTEGLLKKTLAYGESGQFGFLSSPPVQPEHKTKVKNYPLKIYHCTQSQKSMENVLKEQIPKQLKDGRQWLSFTGDASTLMYVEKAVEKNPELQGKILTVLGMFHEVPVLAHSSMMCSHACFSM